LGLQSGHCKVANVKWTESCNAEQHTTDEVLQQIQQCTTTTQDLCQTIIYAIQRQFQASEQINDND